MCMHTRVSIMFVSLQGLKLEGEEDAAVEKALASGQQTMLRLQHEVAYSMHVVCI